MVGKRLVAGLPYSRIGVGGRAVGAWVEPKNWLFELPPPRSKGCPLFGGVDWMWTPLQAGAGGVLMSDGNAFRTLRLQACLFFMSSTMCNNNRASNRLLAARRSNKLLRWPTASVSPWWRVVALIISGNTRQ